MSILNAGVVQTAAMLPAIHLDQIEKTSIAPTMPTSCAGDAASIGITAGSGETPMEGRGGATCWTAGAGVDPVTRTSSVRGVTR